MPKIQKPLLAGKYNPEKAKFPYIATPKIDGIRFLMIDGTAYSRTFKPIRNLYIQKILSESLPNGIDGEITSGNTFQDSQSAVMSIEGEPEDFKIWLFDYVNPDDDEILPYYLRILNFPQIPNDINCEVLHGTNVNNQEELDEIEKIYLENGYEGVMLRDPYGTYKFGRSSNKDNILLKVKRFVDDESILIDIEEKMHNENEAKLDAFGRIKRSTSIEGLMGSGTTGNLITRNKEGQIIKIGSGLNDELRDAIWNNRDDYIGKVVKYKFFQHGVKELPRHPVFLGFRHEDDL
jgi:DNA ligase-1